MRKQSDIIVVIIGLVFAIAILLFTRPDIPPIDDSDLALKLPKVTDSENGYFLLVRALKEAEKIEEREISGKQTDHDIKRYEHPISLLEKAISYPQIIVPMKDLQKYKEFDNRTMDIGSSNDIALVVFPSADQDILKEKKEDALRKEIFVYKFEHAIQSGLPGVSSYLWGRSGTKMVLYRLNDKLDRSIYTGTMVEPYARSLKEFSTDEAERMLLTEYVYQKEYKVLNYLNIKNGRFVDYLFSRLYKPNMEMVNVYRCFRDYRKFIVEPVRDASIDTHRVLVPADRIHVYHGNIFRYIFGASYYQYVPLAFKSIIDSTYFDRFQVRALRLKIAALAYRDKHGKLPENLNDLTPDFIDSIPADPFDGKPIRYDLKKAVLYSVGFNRVDDHGVFTHRMLPYSNVGGVDSQRKSKDIVLNILPPQKK